MIPQINRCWPETTIFRLWWWRIAASGRRVCRSRILVCYCRSFSCCCLCSHWLEQRILCPHSPCYCSAVLLLSAVASAIATAANTSSQSPSSAAWIAVAASILLPFHLLLHAAVASTAPTAGSVDPAVFTAAAFAAAAFQTPVTASCCCHTLPSAPNLASLLICQM